MKDFKAIPAEAGQWEAQKIMFIFEAVRQQTGIDLWGDAYTGVNPNSGYSWVWSEDYPVSFYMPISCELKIGDVMVLWTDPEDGEEYEVELDFFHNEDEIHAWVDELQKINRSQK